MHPFVPHSSGLSCRSAAFAFRPLPFVCRRLLICSSVLSLVSLARARRGSPVFDTDTIPDPTPCEAVTFSWTGGVPPYSLLVGSPDTLSIVSEMDSITDLFVSWTPPSDSVDMTLVAFVFDDDESFDTTNSFVVQPASCLPAGPPAFSSSSVSAEPSILPPYPISPTQRSSVSSTSPSPSPSPSLSTSTHIAPSIIPLPPSSPAQSSNNTTSTQSAGNGTTAVPPHPTTTGTTGAPAASERLPSSQPHPSTTISHWRFTSRPRRKPPSSSPSASEIVGMVLGSVALVGVLIGIIVWRRMTVARGRATSRRGSTTRVEEEGNGPAAGLESSYSTLVQQASQVSTKPIANRHRYSAASASHATPAGIGLGLGSGPAPLLAEDEDGSDILHIHNDTEANSIAVEPSTSCTDDTLVAVALSLGPDSSPLKPPGLSPTRASKTEFPPPGGEGATQVEAVPTETKAREDVQSPGSDVYRISSATAAAPHPHGLPDEEQHVLTLPAETETALGSGSGARARRVTLTLLESDGGVCLAGGPSVDVAVEGEFLSDSGDGSIEIVTLPPPYHQYNS